MSQTLLQYAYVIDIDNTVKPIYGHQEGAELGYNPEKPGRPSHNYHTAFVGTVRLTLTVDVQRGKNHSGTCGLPSLWKLIDALPKKCWPKLVRGDVGYGNETTMLGAEERAIRMALDGIGVFLDRISSTAPQLDFIGKWTLILKVAFRKFLNGRPLVPLTDGSQLLLPLTS